MPELNRRSFLKFASAAGLMPVAPAMLPTSAAAAASSSVTSSQMLWASLAGNARNASGLASTMGISTESAVGICAKLNRAHILSARSAANFRRIPRPTTTTASAPTAARSPNVANSIGGRPSKVNIEEALIDGPTDQVEFEGTDENAVSAEIAPILVDQKKQDLNKKTNTTTEVKRPSPQTDYHA